MKCQEVGAEGLCGDASPRAMAGVRDGSGYPWGCSSHPRAGETRAPPALLEGESVLRGLYFSVGLLKGTQLTPNRTRTPPPSAIQVAAPPANRPGVQRDFQAANATHLYKQPLYPPLGSLLSIYRTPAPLPAPWGCFYRSSAM